jgi:hypothetical protein
MHNAKQKSCEELLNLYANILTLQIISVKFPLCRMYNQLDAFLGQH